NRGRGATRGAGRPRRCPGRRAGAPGGGEGAPLRGAAMTARERGRVLAAAALTLLLAWLVLYPILLVGVDAAHGDAIAAFARRPGEWQALWASVLDVRVLLPLYASRAGEARCVDARGGAGPRRRPVGHAAAGDAAVAAALAGGGRAPGVHDCPRLLQCAVCIRRRVPGDDDPD